MVHPGYFPCQATLKYAPITRHTKKLIFPAAIDPNLGSALHKKISDLCIVTVPATTQGRMVYGCMGSRADPDVYRILVFAYTSISNEV